MKILTPEQIVKQRQNDEIDQAKIEFSTVDINRPFIPEQYTQLYHAEIYAELNNKHRLRYNQLFGARTNEQFILFESGFTNQVIKNILRTNLLNDKKALVHCLNILLEDEKKHSHMFKILNEHCLPDIYHNTQYYFLQLSWLERTLLSIICRYPQYLISLLWLVLLMEEHAVRFSQDILKNKQTENLGKLEENFVLVHQLHLKDEAKHVHIDANLIDFVLEQSSRRKKILNVKLLQKLLQSTLRPKHAGINIINQLVLEFPDLKKSSHDLINTIREFTYDPCMLPLLEDRSQTPVTTALLELYPEFEQSFLM
ncbi:MAG: diiron oxygenase [Gammaproteobacteria bacterium]|nr:diiron oxygenase [Gammaproteobacteria bacterium]